MISLVTAISRICCSGSNIPAGETTNCCGSWRLRIGIYYGTWLRKEAFFLPGTIASKNSINCDMADKTQQEIPAEVTALALKVHSAVHEADVAIDNGQIVDAKALIREIDLAAHDILAYTTAHVVAPEAELAMEKDTNAILRESCRLSDEQWRQMLDETKTERDDLKRRITDLTSELVHNREEARAYRDLLEDLDEAKKMDQVEKCINKIPALLKQFTNNNPS